MADDLFIFESMNDDEDGGPSEDEYDALNDETFGGDGALLDWEEEHETLAQITESSRPHKDHLDLEASLSRLVLDEDVPKRAAPAWPQPPQPPSVGGLKNVCTVEELERQMRQSQAQPQQNYFQPRFPVILQRPPGFPSPVLLPFDQVMQKMNQLNNQGVMHNQGNQMAPNNLIGPHNQMGSNMQMGPNHQIGPNNPIGPNNTIGPNNHLGPNNQMGHNNQMGMNNQLGAMLNNMHGNQMGNNHIGPNNPMGPNNQIGPNNQMGVNNQMGPNNPMGPNNQMMNGNQFGMNQMGPNHMIMPPHMMNQRMMGPPQTMNNMPRPGHPNTTQFNPNFRGGMEAHKQGPIMNQQGNQAQFHQNNQANQQHMGQLFSQNQMGHQAQQVMGQPTGVIGQRSAEKTKPQRSLVFNNSALTSQNLVQLIQSTHPMLVQNSLHNANHHPMLNRTAGHMQRGLHQRPFNNRYVNGDGEEYARDPSDEYAGLMSQREKQWLLNIQMIQLNTATPYIEDYYYTVWQERQARKEREGVKEAHKANQQNHPFYSGGKQESRERHRHSSTSEEQPAPRTYVPAQFENSLGKLQCGSVTAPRKIIDVEVVRETETSGRQSRAASVASTTQPHEGPREVRRTKRTLLDIESLYLTLLTLEELNEPLAIANALVLREREEKARAVEQTGETDDNVFLRNIESVQRRVSEDKASDKRQVVSLNPATDQPKQKNLLEENKEELVNRLFSGILAEDRLPAFLAVRKGKQLIERFLRRVSPPHPRLRALWTRLLRALPAAARRDRDDLVLPSLTTAFRKYVSSSSGWTRVLECSAHLAEALDPARPPHALLSPLTLNCVIVLMEKATPLVTTTEASSSERTWTKFLKNVARSLKNTSTPVARPTEPMSRSDVQTHVRLVEAKTTVEILQRGRTDYIELAKNELCEILVKHLC